MSHFAVQQKYDIANLLYFNKVKKNKKKTKKEVRGHLRDLRTGDPQTVYRSLLESMMSQSENSS